VVQLFWHLAMSFSHSHCHTHYCFCFYSHPCCYSYPHSTLTLLLLSPLPLLPFLPFSFLIPPFSSPSLILLFSFTQHPLLPLFPRLPCPSPILTPTPTLIHALTITLTPTTLHTQIPMPFVMAWTPGTSTHIFRLEKTHPLFAQDDSIALSISTGHRL
jgi:hypothetical protein